MTRSNILEHYTNRAGRLNSRLIRSSEDAKDEWFRKAVAETSFLDDECSLSARLGAIRQGFRDRPACVKCGNDVKFDRVWPEFCGPGCSFDTEARKESRKKVDIAESNARREASMLEKYGATHNLLRPDVRKKLGVHNSLDEYKEAARQRGLKQFGHFDRSLLTVDNVVEMNMTMSVPAIAAHIGCSQSAVLHLLHANGHRGNREVYSSHPENIVKNILTMLELQYSACTRDVIPPSEIDLWVPGSNLGIEVNGLYWHSELTGGKGRSYHLDKLTRIEAFGGTLLQFTDLEVIEKTDIVASMIASKAGKSKKLMARKLSLVELTSAEAASFFVENHIQGRATCKGAIGLKADGEIVSAMSFGPSRFIPGMTEVIRFCNLRGHTVVGGFSRLSSKIPGLLISYANRRWSKGNMYLAAGFRLHSTSAPGYQYIVNGRPESRLKYTKKKLIAEGHDPEMSEWEIMLSLGHDRIWDCGNYVFHRG